MKQRTRVLPDGVTADPALVIRSGSNPAMNVSWVFERVPLSPKVRTRIYQDGTLYRDRTYDTKVLANGALADMLADLRRSQTVNAITRKGMFNANR